MKGSKAYEPEEYEYIRRDTSALTKLIRQSIPRYAREEETTENEEWNEPRGRIPEISSGSARDRILTFIIEDYLKFPKLHPAEVVEFYTPTLIYNGDLDLTRERVVQIHFSRYRRLHQHSMNLVRRSVRIRKSRHYPNSYDVSFLVFMKSDHRHRPGSNRRSVKLLIDLDMKELKILAETNRRY